MGEQLTRKAQARSLRAVAGLVAELRVEDTARAGTHGGRVGEFVADQVAAVLGVSRRTAELRIEDALALTGRLPRTLAALEAGFLSAPVAHVLVRETENTTPEVAGEVEARVLDRLGRGCLDGLGRLSRGRDRLRRAAAPRPGRADRGPRHRAASCARWRGGRWLRWTLRRSGRSGTVRGLSVTWTCCRGVAGMTWVGAPLTEAEAAAVYDRLDRTARDLKSCPESPARSVSSARMCSVTCSSPTAGCLAGVRAQVQLHITIDRSGAVTADRVGAVHPEVLTDLLALARDTGGRVKVRAVDEQVCPGNHPDLDVRPDPYRPSAALAAAVIARDVTCRFPGCVVPASALRPRPRHRPPRRTDLLLQSVRIVPTPPPAQDPRRLDPHPPRRRALHLARPHRAHLRRLARLARRPLGLLGPSRQGKGDPGARCAPWRSHAIIRACVRCTEPSAASGPSSVASPS